VDEYGLDEMDARILKTIIEHFDGGPVGLSTLAVAVGEDAGTLEEVYEPFLIQNGFLMRSPAAASPRTTRTAASATRSLPLAASRRVAGQPVRGLMHVVCLSAPDRRLLRARFAEHGNSHRRMRDALATPARQRRAARGAAPHRAPLRPRPRGDLPPPRPRHDSGTHPIERLVLDFIAEERRAGDGAQLWVMPERVRQVRDLMAGKLTGDLEA
jgi:hypothetical protein